jgi:cytochrome c biogenesis protein CcmG, thiol:disulfide interchange protein DsbE
MEPGQVASPTARRTRRWVTVAAVLVPAAAVLGLLGYGFSRDARYIPTPLLAQPAPAFALPLFDGGDLQKDELRGHVVVLNFWASWCAPCRAEAPMLEAAARKYRDQGVLFVGANIQDREADARRFLEEFGVTYPNGVDRGSRVAIDYGVWGLPETFVIDRTGRITYKHVGELSWAALTAKVDEALDGRVSRAEGRGAYQSTQ